MKTRFLILMALCCLVLPATFAQDVTYNYLPGTDFTKYHTYRWIVIEGGVHPNQIVDGQIKQSIDSQLAAKGFTKANGENADLSIGYQVAVDQEKQLNGYGMGGGLRWGGMDTVTSSAISVGTLVLDVYNSAAKQLVWTGRATKTLDPSSNPEKNEKNLNKAIAKLLSNFPPKAK